MTAGSWAQRSPVLAWFGPPALSTPDATQRARYFWLVSWGFFGVLALVLAVLVVTDPSTVSRRLVTLALVFALTLPLHLVNVRGHPTLASWLLVVGVITIATARMWTVGGIHGPVPVFYVLCVLMAGSLLGNRASIVVAALCVLGGLVLVVAELAGWIGAARPSFGVWQLEVSLAATIGLALVLQRLMTQALTESLARANAEIVERARIEKELQKYQQGLETLVAERTAELAQSVDRLRASEQLRDDLVHMVVHDMRSPLTVMLAQLNLMQMDAPPTMTTNLQRAVRGATELNQLANTLLDVSRLEAGKMPITRATTDLSALARKVQANFATLEPGRTIETTGNDAALCDCDASLIQRVLENLVSNAIKHTPKPGAVRIRVAREASSVRVSVQDEGPGVPAEAKARIFEKFTTGPARTGNAYHSVGLGLAFCRLAVEAHRGTIAVEDATPRGSVFAFELPG